MTADSNPEATVRCCSISLLEKCHPCPAGSTQIAQMGRQRRDRLDGVASEALRWQFLLLVNSERWQKETQTKAQSHHAT